jgi:hypothetical protein
MQCPSCGTAVRPGQKFCMECGASLRGVADDTGEVPVIRSQTPPSGTRDEVTQAMDRLSSRDDDRPTGTAGFPPPATAGATAAAAQPRAAGVDPLLRGSDSAEAPSTEERFYGAHQPANGGDPNATAPIAWTADRPGDQRAAADATYAYGPGVVTDEREYVYDDHDEWHDDWAEAERPPRTFRFRVLFPAAVLAAAACVVGVLSDLISIRPDAGVTAPFDTGTWMVNDFGTNNTVAALLAATVLVVGAALWCFGFRWGAGLAGGAGLSLAGWAALMVGLAEWPIFDAERAAAAAPAAITRELGYWAVVAAGGLGVVAFCACLGGSGRDRQGGLDPWIAALGAACFLVAAGGPLIPLGTADFSGNYSSDTLGVDLPQMFFVGRLLQVGLLAFSGIVGFLLVRRFGLGMAIGGAVSAGYMLATAATNQTATPIGPAFANPGAVTLDPHGVTVVGFALAGFFGLVAVVMALLDSGR